jgi:hypothetical protein
MTTTPTGVLLLLPGESELLSFDLTSREKHLAIYNFASKKLNRPKFIIVLPTIFDSPVIIRLT